MKWLLIVIGIHMHGDGKNYDIYEVGRVPGWTTESLCKEAAKDLIDKNMVNARCEPYQDTAIILPQAK